MRQRIFTVFLFTRTTRQAHDAAPDVDANADEDDRLEADEDGGRGGRGAAWTWSEELTAFVALNAASARQMESPVADRIAAVNLAYVDYSAEVAASVGWAPGREGTRQPATREESIVVRHANDPMRKGIWRRAKLTVTPQVKKVRIGESTDVL